MQNENTPLNKDFTLSQQADAAQKAQEEERIKRLHQIEETKERLRIEQMVKTRDTEMQRDMQLKQQEQEKAIRDEAQRRLDAQSLPSLDMNTVKRAMGMAKSPDMVHDQVNAEMKAHHERELAGYGAGLAVSYNKVIDPQIDKALEAQERMKQEQSFEKSADKPMESSRDAFSSAHDRQGGEKDWRSLREEREAAQQKDRDR